MQRSLRSRLSGRHEHVVLNILLIDDDDQVRTSLAALLRRDGHVVRVASNGKHGIRLFREALADVVITDILMPGMDGFETIRELRNLYADVKIVAISGGGEIDATMALDLAAKLGATRILLKPFSNAELTFAISKFEAELSG